MVFGGFVHCDCLFGLNLGCVSNETGPNLNFLHFGHLVRHFWIDFACLRPQTGHDWFLVVLVYCDCLFGSSLGCVSH